MGGPVFERMLDSFSVAEESHKEKELFYCFEHFENKISLDFPKFLEYSQEDCLIKLFDIEHPLNVFELQCYAETKQQKFPSLLDVQQAIISSIDPAVNVKLQSYEESTIADIPSVEFMCTGFFSSDPALICKKTTMLVKKDQKLYCWSFLCEEQNF